MRKLWIHSAKSFKEAGAFDNRYYLRMSPQERLATVQWLREIDAKRHRRSLREARERLRRSIKIIQQA